MEALGSENVAALTHFRLRHQCVQPRRIVLSLADATKDNLVLVFQDLPSALRLTDARASIEQSYTRQCAWHQQSPTHGTSKAQEREQ